jgi:hypothetical protein
MTLQPGTSKGRTSVGETGVAAGRATREAQATVIDVDVVVNSTARRLTLDCAVTLLGAFVPCRSPSTNCFVGHLLLINQICARERRDSCLKNQV